MFVRYIYLSIVSICIDFRGGGVSKKRGDEQKKNCIYSKIVCKCVCRFDVVSLCTQNYAKTFISLASQSFISRGDVITNRIIHLFFYAKLKRLRKFKINCHSLAPSLPFSFLSDQLIGYCMIRKITIHISKWSSIYHSFANMNWFNVYIYISIYIVIILFHFFRNVREK